MQGGRVDVIKKPHGSGTWAWTFDVPLAATTPDVAAIIEAITVARRIVSDRFALLSPKAVLLDSRVLAGA
jgi:hypothetical protein